MLEGFNVHAVVAVKDMAAAKAFYGGTLGLPQVSDGEEGVMYQCGNSKVMVYQSQFAGTNQATTASWEVEDVEKVVSGLAGKGVVFEHYDTIPGVTRQGDVHAWGDMKSAWFKDPDGNILCVATG